MTSRLLTPKKTDASANEAHSFDIDLFVQRLVRQVLSTTYSPKFSALDGETAEIIYEKEVDGARCLLVRLQSKSIQSQSALSPREQEIARMVADGYVNKTIAGVLGISEWTVSTHIRRIFSKLGVCSRAAMVARLTRVGLMREQPDGVKPVFEDASRSLKQISK